MKNFIQPGRVITVPAPANTLSGAGVLVGTLFGVATYDALINEPLEIALEGVFELPKTSAQAWTIGQAVYWDAANSVVTTTVGSNVKIGAAIEIAANPSPIGRVRLSVSANAKLARAGTEGRSGNGARLQRDGAAYANEERCHRSHTATDHIQGHPACWW